MEHVSDESKRARKSTHSNQYGLQKFRETFLRFATDGFACRDETMAITIGEMEDTKDCTFKLFSTMVVY